MNLQAVFNPQTWLSHFTSLRFRKMRLPWDWQPSAQMQDQDWGLTLLCLLGRWAKVSSKTPILIWGGGRRELGQQQSIGLVFTNRHCCHLGPLHMSLVNGAGPLTACLGFIWEISAWFSRWEKARVLASNSRTKANMANWHIRSKFGFYITSANLKPVHVSLQLNEVLMMCLI